MPLRPQARGQMPAGQMNKTEAAYASHLETRKRAGEIAEYWWDPMTLKLAEDCRYRLDFMVLLKDGVLECHEVKGFWRDDARVKVKVAAAKFPFRFVAVTKRSMKQGGGWEAEKFFEGEVTI